MQHNKALKLRHQTEELDGCFCLVNYIDGIIVRKTGTSTYYIYRKLRWDTPDHSVGHFGSYGGIVRNMGLDSLVLRSEVSFGHFGTAAEMPGHFWPMSTVPNCLGFEVSGYRKKPIWILLKQETVSGSGISWAICKSAPRSRQITTPAPHHSDKHPTNNTEMHSEPIHHSNWN